MKKLFFTCTLILFCIIPIQAQKVYSVAYQNQADVKVFVVQYENQARFKSV